MGKECSIYGGEDRCIEGFGEDPCPLQCPRQVTDMTQRVTITPAVPVTLLSAVTQR